ncbi:4-(cytidine 5'-diphospho)-2-C-methyl-D-erythritol kinase [Allobranchiibius sp. GilTou73]|uniref:4-(cytidine 5'-diphospho)-2-C-methyl-D-erythritol kinase n=1 Tax=Allobranchiibius sp. GilTou73 TaxID=2904523 RepID=UPI001F2CE5D2|nr:4-(cytidine 5'-diphospho)-2-C-methyl-D-erythritol kinase [Allobranchiibius sp. GilTou73]UIJ34868.1 4-(cytidine 5'-diphospho)-2-C-methyl-D-erythritol kinase [Allobranchiibius sp. GilTou73]
MRTVPSSPGVQVRVPAKVNLELQVGPLRDDGYHSLATVFHAVNLTDEVRVTPATHWGCAVNGPYAAAVPTGTDNLAVRAVQLLGERFGIEEMLQIDIDKHIPVAGGMAGGSADAAAALVAADALWSLGLTRADLMGIGAEIGSDVPFAITGGTALGSGRGEVLAPVLTQADFHWVFALQHEGLSTPKVYAECDRLRVGESVPAPEPSGALMSALRSGDVDELAPHLRNDLQDAAISLMPRLREVIDTGMEAGACGAVVCGSGPTVAFLCASHHLALDLMVTLSAGKVADDVVRAVGPAPGAHVVTDLHSVGPA